MTALSVLGFTQDEVQVSFNPLCDWLSVVKHIALFTFIFTFALWRWTWKLRYEGNVIESAQFLLPEIVFVKCCEMIHVIISTVVVVTVHE